MCRHSYSWFSFASLCVASLCISLYTVSFSFYYSSATVLLFFSNQKLNRSTFFFDCFSTLSYSSLSIQLITWTAGWTQMMRVLLTRGDLTARVFAGQMYMVGLSTVCFFPVGFGRVSDQIHGVCAGLYFVYHIVLFKYLQTQRIYQLGFYSSFGTFVYFLHRLRVLENKYNFKAEANQKQKKELPLSVSKKIYQNELGMMITENTMFWSFLFGMTSGIRHLF